MLINRHNYEEFFLLYVDNELSVADRQAVEAFVEQNPDLEEELVMMMQSVLRPDTNIVFGNKEMLLKNKSVNGLVNESNYEEYFVLYGDNELSNEEKDLVEQFVYKHPQYQAEFELIQQARLLPDHGIIYPDKNELYRTERDERVITFRWWKIAAAAIVLLFLAVTAWYMTNTKTGDTEPFIADGKNTTDSNKENKTVQPPVNNGGQMAAVKEERSPAVDAKKNLPVVEEKNSFANSNIERNKNVIRQRAANDVVNSLTASVNKKLVEPTVVNHPDEPEVNKRNEVKASTINTAMLAANTAPKPEVAIESIEPGTAINQPKAAIYYYIDEYSTDEDIKLANASISKKPVRGLIRKVKGLFEGNNVEEDANDPRPENKKGIRIAAFQVSLK